MQGSRRIGLLLNTHPSNRGILIPINLEEQPYPEFETDYQNLFELMRNILSITCHNETIKQFLVFLQLHVLCDHDFIYTLKKGLVFIISCFTNLVIHVFGVSLISVH